MAEILSFYPNFAQFVFPFWIYAMQISGKYMRHASDIDILQINVFLNLEILSQNYLKLPILYAEECNMGSSICAVYV